MSILLEDYALLILGNSPENRVRLCSAAAAGRRVFLPRAATVRLFSLGSIHNITEFYSPVERLPPFFACRVHPGKHAIPRKKAIVVLFFPQVFLFGQRCAMIFKTARRTLPWTRRSARPVGATTMTKNSTNSTAGWSWMRTSFSGSLPIPAADVPIIRKETTTVCRGNKSGRARTTL